MASSLQLQLHLLLLLLVLSYSLFLGHAHWLVPVTKDPATLQYIAHTRIGGSTDPIGLVVDLGGRSIWLDCSPSFSSRPIGSCSVECSKAYGSCSHSSSACDLSVENSITRSTATGEVAEASLAVGSALISCAPNHLLRGLAIGSRGMLGLGRSRIALPSQIARRFALCLSSSDGFFISGHGHDLVPITNSLAYTPLVELPRQIGYFVKVNQIKINGKRLALAPLTAEISTVEPYSKMESSVFAKFVKGFSNMRRVAAVEPFNVCYASARGGAVDVPVIDLVLQSEMVRWRVEGVMVRVSEEVVCLGLVDGGADMEVPIVVGGHQLEDVWLQFDLASSMLGFSRNTSCSSLTYQIQDLMSNQSL